MEKKTHGMLWVVIILLIINLFKDFLFKKKKLTWFGAEEVKTKNEIRKDFGLPPFKEPKDNSFTSGKWPEREVTPSKNYYKNKDVIGKVTHMSVGPEGMTVFGRRHTDKIPTDPASLVHRALGEVVLYDDDDAKQFVQSCHDAISLMGCITASDVFEMLGINLGDNYDWDQYGWTNWKEIYSYKVFGKRIYFSFPKLEKLDYAKNT